MRKTIKSNTQKELELRIKLLKKANVQHYAPISKRTEQKLVQSVLQKL